MSLFKTGLIWGDAPGFTSLLTLYTGNNAPNALISAMQGCSNGDWSSLWTGAQVQQVAAVVNGTYNSVLDRALFTFETAAGRKVTLRIPAPKLSIFQADFQTIDVTSPAAAALIAAALLYLTDNGGNPVVSSSGGFYERTGKALTGGF